MKHSIALYDIHPFIVARLIPLALMIAAMMTMKSVTPPNNPPIMLHGTRISSVFPLPWIIVAVPNIFQAKLNLI